MGGFLRVWRSPRGLSRADEAVPPRREPCAGVVDSPWTFLAALAAVLAWIATGAIFDWSGGWVLWPATITSVGAFLLVLLLQYTQNRDTRAIQLKLDELIRSVEDARTELVRVEHRTDEEVGEIADEFAKLRRGDAA